MKVDEPAESKVEFSLPSHGFIPLRSGTPQYLAPEVASTLARYDEHLGYGRFFGPKNSVGEWRDLEAEIHYLGLYMFKTPVFCFQEMIFHRRVSWRDSIHWMIFHVFSTADQKDSVIWIFSFPLLQLLAVCLESLYSKSNSWWSWTHGVKFCLAKYEEKTSHTWHSINQRYKKSSCFCFTSEI